MKLPKAPERTTPAFAFSMVERALQECLATRQFGQDEMMRVLAFFGTDHPECVFCESSEVKRWDHLIPVSKGGETVLGNMVPACARCDDSKRDLYFEEWMTSNATGSPKSCGVKHINQRVELIKTYVEHFHYTPRSLEERLNKKELGKLKIIRLRLRELRRDIENLIEGHRAETEQAFNRGKPH